MSELPKGWEKTALENVLAQIIGGGTPSKNVASNFVGNIPFMTVKDMKVRFPVDTIDHISEDAVKSSATTLVPEDSLIVATRMSLGKVVRPTCAVAINQDLKVLVPATGLDKTFLEYFWRSQAKLIDELGTGTTVKGIRLDDIKNLELPLAPLPEQKRIADKLDATLARVDACCERLARVAPILKRFRQSVLAAATSGQLTADWREQQGYGHAGDDDKALQGNPCVGRADEGSPTSAAHGECWASQAQPNLRAGQSSSTVSILKTPLVIFQADQGNLVEGWSWEKLVTLAKLESGHTPRKSVPEYWENGSVPWISLQDIRAADGREITATKYMPTKLGIDNSSARLLPKGTVCFCRDISFGYVTMMGREMATTQHFANWVCHDGLVPKYLMYAFMAGRDFLGMSSGQGTTVTTIYMPALKELRLATPPVAEQTEIVRRVETLFAFADRLEARLASASTAAERLTPSLLAKAFRGELVPQDPNDEPASELLKRLAAQREAMPKAKRGKKSATTA